MKVIEEVVEDIKLNVVCTLMAMQYSDNDRVLITPLRTVVSDEDKDIDLSILVIMRQTKPLPYEIAIRLAKVKQDKEKRYKSIKLGTFSLDNKINLEAFTEKDDSFSDSQEKKMSEDKYERTYFRYNIKGIPTEGTGDYCLYISYSDSQMKTDYIIDRVYFKIV
ncbi:MAG: hypothetical protein ACK5L0_04770 [Candidatus Fimivivens sp.]